MSEIFSTVVKFAPLALTAACGTPVSAGDPTPPLGPMVTSRSTGNGTLTATPITEQAVSDEGGGGYSLPWITPRYSHDNPPTGLATAVGQVYQATEKIQKNAPDSYSTVTVVSPDNQLQATFGPQLVFSGSGASVRWVGLNGGLHLVADGYLEVSPTDGTQSIVARTLPAEQTLLKVEDAISIQQGFNLENGEIGEKIMEQTLRPGMTFGDFAQEAATARTPAEWQNIYYKYFGSVTLFDPSQGTRATKIFDQPNTTAQNGSDNFDNSIEEHLPVKQISQRVTITPSSTNMPPSQTPQPAEATPGVTQIAQAESTATTTPVVEQNETQGSEYVSYNEYTGEYNGVAVNFGMGLDNDIVTRTDRPISEIRLNTEKFSETDARNRAAQAVLSLHWFGYESEHPGTTFDQFVDKIKNGEDVTYTKYTTPKGQLLNPELTVINPTAHTTIILTDHPGFFTATKSDAKFLPRGVSAGFSLDENGGLVISQFIPPEIFWNENPGGIPDAKNAPVVSGRVVIKLNDTFSFFAIPNSIVTWNERSDFMTNNSEKLRANDSILAVKGSGPVIKVIEP